jgi:hypothetical protein
MMIGMVNPKELRDEPAKVTIEMNARLLDGKPESDPNYYRATRSCIFYSKTKSEY